MKNIFLAIIVIGFAIIVFSSLNKLNHIEIYEVKNGEKIAETAKVIKNKESIKEISNLLKGSKITNKKRDIVKPDFVIKTSSSEYYLWIEGNNGVLFADKKHPSVFYEDKGIDLLKYIK